MSVAVVGAVALPASAADHHEAAGTVVYISDVQYDSPGREPFQPLAERRVVELINDSRWEVDLDGWTLEDEDGHTYTVDHYRLNGRATVRVHTGIGRDARTDLFQDRRGYVWDNHSDTATLRNDRGPRGALTTHTAECPLTAHAHGAERVA